MNNVKIAKELLKLAKNLTADKDKIRLLKEALKEKYVLVERLQDAINALKVLEDKHYSTDGEFRRHDMSKFLEQELESTNEQIQKREETIEQLENEE